MDLIGVNNSVVNMRKAVIKAKIHVIRQLLKQSKTFTAKKVANEEQRAKNLRKSERLRSEVHIIKHLKKDDVSRAALLNTQNFLPEINPDKDAERLDELLKKRAFVRLANSSVLKKEVESFRKKYPTWKEELPKVFRVLGKKQKKKEEKMKKKKREEEKQKKKESKQGKDGIKKDEKSSENEENSEASENEQNSDEQENSEHSEEDSDDENEINEAIAETEVKVPQPVSKSKGEMVIKQLDLNELIANSDSDNESSDTNENTLENKTSAKAVPKDSFFIGGANDEGEESDDEVEMDHSDFTTDVAVSRKRNDFMGKGAGFQNSRGHRGHNDRSFNQERGRGRGRGFSDRGRWFSDRGRGFSDRGRGFSDRGRGLNSIGRGFSDRGRGLNNRGRDGNSLSRGHFDKPEEKLHPSWAAKKSQKPMIISGVQSKKIKFDGTDEPRPAVAEVSSNLHPSWAAKKTTNKGIQPFAGKKVVFGNDDD